MASNTTVNAKSVNTQTLNINGSLTFDHQAMTSIDEAEANANNTINATSHVVIVTNRGTDGHDRVYLPSPVDVPLGHTVYVVNTHATLAIEVSAKGDGVTATTINGTAVSTAGGAFAAEDAVAAKTFATCVKNAAHSYLVTVSNAGGVPDS
jgi:hypothetical protein